MIKSPFLALPEFISPLDCEDILSSLDLSYPNTNEKDAPIKTVLKAPITQSRIWKRAEEYFDSIEAYYDVEIDSMNAVDVEWYPESCVEESPRCENSIYISDKWRVMNDYDFTMVVFLKDFNSNPDFDIDFECYGGKLEFINHQFGFNPQRGTAILFPGNQYFINRTASPKMGDAMQLRTHLTCTERFKYHPQNYEGNYKTWFSKAS